MLHWVEVEYKYDDAKKGEGGGGTIHAIIDVPNDRRDIPLWAALQAMTNTNTSIEVNLPACIAKMCGAKAQRQKRLHVPRDMRYRAVYEHKTNGKVLAAEIVLRTCPALNVPNTYGMEFKS